MSFNLSNFYRALGEYAQTQRPDFYDDAFRTAIGHEGGYVFNPKDPGGETKFGLAKKYNPDLDIKNLTLDQAKNIYKERYWDKYKLDQFNDEHKTEAFNMLINSPSRAAKAIQRTVGVKPDGAIGPKTIEAMSKYKNDVMVDAKKEYFKSLAEDKINSSNVTQRENWQEHANGWANRYLDTDIFGDGKGKISLKNKSLKEVLALIK